MQLLKKIALFAWSGWLFLLTRALAFLFCKLGLLRAARVPDGMSSIQVLGQRFPVRIFYALGFLDRVINASLIGGTAAVSLPGAVVLNLSVAGSGKLAAIWRHECEHERQWAALGVLFLPCYLIASLIAAVRGEGWYAGNYFEVRARDFAFRQLTRRGR